MPASDGREMVLICFASTNSALESIFKQALDSYDYSRPVSIMVFMVRISPSDTTIQARTNSVNVLVFSSTQISITKLIPPTREPRDLLDQCTFCTGHILIPSNPLLPRRAMLTAVSHLPWHATGPQEMEIFLFGRPCLV